MKLPWNNRNSEMQSKYFTALVKTNSISDNFFGGEGGLKQYLTFAKQSDNFLVIISIHILCKTLKQ